MEGRLKGKVALVTGAGIGIGKAIALRFAEEGAKVGVNVYHSLDKGKKTVERIKGDGGSAILLKADVSQAKQVEDMIDSLVSEYGKIDVLVNNSGIGASESPDRVAELTEKDWDRVNEVNLKGAFLTCRSAIPKMSAQGGGTIINISSIRGLKGNPGLASYCATKGGMVLLSSEMALDYAGQGIRVNCICPGFTETEMLLGYIDKQEDPEAARNAFSAMAVMDRIGHPEEIAGAAVFFASDESSFVTGAALPVDGGYLVNGVRELL